MSRRSAAPLLAAIAATMLVIPTASPADPWLPAPGDYSSEILGTHFGNGGRRFDGEGETIDLSFVEETRQIHAVNELGWKKWVSFRLGGSFRSVTRSVDSAPGPTGMATRTGLADLLVGMRFKLHDRGGLALAIETNWLAPMGYEREDEPSLGDGLNRFSGHLEAGLPIAPLRGFAQASLGYATRVDVHMNPMKATRAVGSPRMLYEADLAAGLGQPWLVAARYAGFSESGDTEEGDVSSHAAGPEVRYRVDDRMEVFAGATFDVAGRNTWKQKVYYIGLAMKQTRLHRLQGFLGSDRRP